MSRRMGGYRGYDQYNSYGAYRNQQSYYPNNNYKGYHQQQGNEGMEGQQQYQGGGHFQYSGGAQRGRFRYPNQGEQSHSYYAQQQQQGGQSPDKEQISPQGEGGNFEENKEGGYPRSGRGGRGNWRGPPRGRRGGGNYRGGGGMNVGGPRQYKESYQTKDIPAHVVPVDTKEFPSLEEHNESPPRNKYSKEAIIDVYKNSGKIERDSTLTKDNEIAANVVKFDGYQNLELIQPSTHDRKDSFHGSGEKMH